MAELATIARPYAEALFKAAHADLAGTQTWLDALTAAVHEPSLLRFAADPRTRSEEVFTLLTSVLLQALPVQGENFLRMVIDNGRLAALPEVAKQFRQLANNESGQSDAVVYSAFAINEAELAELKTLLEKRFSRKLEIQVHIDPELIGGVRVVVGDEVLDLSIHARLQQMKSALTA